MGLLRLIFSGFVFIFAQSAFSYTLDESYKSAILNTKTDNISESRILQNQALKSKGRGYFLPTLSARANYQKQDKFDDQKNLGLNLSASLYNGGRDRQILDTADKSIQISQNLKELDRMYLFMDVAEIYYNYLLNLNEMNNLELLKKQSQERVDEIKRRVQIGRSRKGELLQAEAQLASVEAQTSNSLGLLKQAEAQFVILTGLPKKDKFDVSFEVLLASKDLEDYLQMALSREDVKNKELEIERLNGQLNISKAHMQPSLDLLSNYYFVKKGGSSISRNSDWDVGVTLTLPLFEGGSSQAQVREDLEKKQTAIYQLSDYKREVTSEVTSRYELFRRYQDQIKAYDTALDKSKKSYEETLRDFRLGLVTNLDVLTSLNFYLSSKREAEKIKIQAVLNFKLLEAAVGNIPRV